MRVDAVVGDRRHPGVSELSVSTDVNLVGFELGALSYTTRAEAMVYRYRLLGHDSEWSTTHDTEVEYADLP